MRFELYIEKQSTTREQVPSGRPVWSKRVLASTSREALIKCLPEIRTKVLPKVDPSIEFVSVYIGQKGESSRMHPIQIVRKTGEIR